MSLGESLVLWLCRPNFNVPGVPVGSLRIHPDVLAGVLILVGLYFTATGAMRARGIVPSRRQRIYLTLVLVILLVAEVSPLHDIAEGYLFSFHMIQHLLMILLLPPLLLAGLPQEIFAPIVRSHWGNRVARVVTHPIFALIIGNAAYTLWHLPRAYQSALIWHELHILEHVLMVGTAILMWWPVISPVRELPTLAPPAKLLYLFVLNIAQIGVFAYVTFNNRIVYPLYASAPRLFGISPEVDQVLAGIIMKVGMALVYIPFMIYFFFRWAKEEEASNPPVGA